MKKGYMKKYYKEHKEEIKKDQKAYREKNKKNRRLYNKKYYQMNKDKKRENLRKWRKKNPTETKKSRNISRIKIPYLDIPLFEKLKENTIKNKNGCWVWKNKIKLKHGYPKMKYKGKENQISRVIFELFYKKPIPKNMCACHKCDNTKCINPKHIFIGTMGDNNRDMYGKGRNRNLRGKEHPRAKLTKEKVKKIKILLKTNTQREVAKMFNVGKTTIGDINLKKRWANFNK